MTEPNDTLSLETLLRMDLGQLLVLFELVAEARLQRIQAEPLERVQMRAPKDKPLRAAD